jgi:hypothetical protein
MTIDLDAYFKRIGYSGDRKPTLATLRELHRLQPAAIAFENLTPLMGDPVPLDAPSLHAKMAAGGRGGYCFEQNLLLASVLEALGFRFRYITGWPRWGVMGTPRPRTHLLLLIAVDGEDWLADVGFGGNTLTAPLALNVEGEQKTPHEAARIVRETGGYLIRSIPANGAISSRSISAIRISPSSTWATGTPRPIRNRASATNCWPPAQRPTRATGWRTAVSPFVRAMARPSAVNSKPSAKSATRLATCSGSGCQTIRSWTAH